MFPGLIGILSLGFMAGWYLWHRKTTPFNSLITVGGIFLILGFILFVFALLADMLGRHRRISEELLYLARKRTYQMPRLPRLMSIAPEVEREPMRAVSQQWDLESSDETTSTRAAANR